MEVKYATERLIDSVWTLEYVHESDNSIKILGYSRTNKIGYDQEKILPRLRLIQGTDRTVTEVILSPYKPFKAWASMSDQDATLLKVTNPQHMFSYSQ